MNHASNLEKRLNQLTGDDASVPLCDQDDRDQAVDLELALECLLSNRELIQHTTRHVVADGEVATGYFRCHFQPGQQRAVIHFNFTPPLACLPDISATLMDDVSARIRVTDCQRYGTRVEVVLDQPVVAPCKALVEIVACGSKPK